MKFKSLQDKQLFLLELGKVDLYSSITEEWEPDTELMELYLKSRKPLITGLSDFRKSQDGKQNWRRNRHRIMKGIKNFHKSTKGKRFHRALSQYLINHESVTNPVPVYEVLKALNSLKTHFYIELDYYVPIEESIILNDALEYLIPCACRVEQALLSANSPLKEDLEILSVLVHPSDMAESLNVSESEFLLKLEKHCEK